MPRCDLHLLPQTEAQMNSKKKEVYRSRLVELKVQLGHWLSFLITQLCDCKVGNQLGYLLVGGGSRKTLLDRCGRAQVCILFVLQSKEIWKEK